MGLVLKGLLQEVRFGDNLFLRNFDSDLYSNSPISGQCSHIIFPENTRALSTKKQRFSCVFRGFKMGALTEIGLIQ